MRLAFSLAAAALLNIVLHPVSASASERFATVEALYSDKEGRLILGSLRATQDQSPVDGQYTFEGYAIAEGKQVPWEVSVPAAMDPPDVATVTIGGGSISQTASYAFKAGGSEVIKSFYDVKGEQHFGVMSVTDDPLPIVAWIIIAGAAAVIVPLGVYVAQGCEKITTKTTFSGDSVSYETSCERQ